MLQDAPARRRQLVDELRDVWKVSVRKACNALRIDRSLYTYKSKGGEQAYLKLRIKETCETGPLRLQRPQSAIGNKPPISLMKAYGASGPP